MPVEAHKEVFQAEALVDDVGEVVLGEFADDGVDFARDGEAQAGAVARGDLGAGDGEVVRGRASELDLQRSRLALAQRVHRPGLDDGAAADEGDALADLLHVGQDVGGHKDGGSPVAHLSDDGEEFLAHQGVERFGGLVHNEEVGVVAHRVDEAEFLGHAGRVALDAAAEGGVRQLEPVEQLFLAREGSADSAQARRVVEERLAGEAGGERDDVGQEAEPGLHGDRVAPSVHSQRARLALIGADEAREDADGRCFARAVGAEEAEHLAALDREVDALERVHAAEALSQPRRPQRAADVRRAHADASGRMRPPLTRKTRARSRNSRGTALRSAVVTMT